MGKKIRTTILWLIIIGSSCVQEPYNDDPIVLPKDTRHLLEEAHVLRCSYIWLVAGRELLRCEPKQNMVTLQAVKFQKT